MTTIRVHFRNGVFVPDRPIDLPTGTTGEVRVAPDAEAVGQDAAPSDGAPAASNALTPLQELALLSEQFPADPDTPTDLATQLDHYLYGTPKHENP